MDVQIRADNGLPHGNDESCSAVGEALWDGVEGGSVAVAALVAPLQSPSGLMPPLTNAVSSMDFTRSCMFQANTGCRATQRSCFVWRWCNAGYWWSDDFETVVV